MDLRSKKYVKVNQGGTNRATRHIIKSRWRNKWANNVNPQVLRPRRGRNGNRSTKQRR